MIVAALVISATAALMKENGLLEFVPLALGQPYRVLHGHKVCLHLNFEADTASL